MAIALEIVDRQPTDDNMHHTVEELAKLLYPIHFEKEGGKHNLIVLIMDKANYTERFGAQLTRPKILAIYNISIADGTTGAIRAKTEAIHRAHITN